jgi:alpha-L-fucosidase
MLLRNLVDIASKGGNYLLNVGPTSEGLIPEPSVQRLEQLGQWMKQNGESIYATTASPFKRLAWGRCTTKRQPGGATLYLQVFDWPADGKLVVPGLKNEVQRAYLLVDPEKKPLAVRRQGDDLAVTLPERAPDKVCSVVVLVLRGEPDVVPVLPAQAADGSIVLPAAEAICHGSQIKYEAGHHRDNIGCWFDPQEWVQWKFRVNQPGRFAVTAEIAAPTSASFTIAAGGKKLDAKAPVTGDYAKFKTVSLGALEIARAGAVSLSLRPVATGWHPLNLKSITLRPAK